MRAPLEGLRPPAGETEGQEITGSARSVFSVLDQATVAALTLRHEFAVVVRSERRDGVTVEQVYTTLGAAQRKIRTVRDRGLRASATLVRLVPVASATSSLEALIGGEVR